MSDLLSHIVPIPANCPACGKLLDAATNVTGQRAPTTGDCTVCFGCGALLTFSGVGLSLIGESELQDMDPAVRKKLLAAKALIDRFVQFKRRN